MADLGTPWIGSAYRHIPDDPQFDVLDFRFAGFQPGNRWNARGEPTLYLAGDPGVLVAEWGRHLGAGFSGELPDRVAMRKVYQLHLRLDAVIDLRDWRHAHDAGVSDPLGWVLEKDRTRSIAQQLRNATPAQGILVPSVAFLDDLTRWNLVVFLDKLPADPHVWIQRVEAVGPLRWGD